MALGINANIMHGLRLQRTHLITEPTNSGSSRGEETYTESFVAMDADIKRLTPVLQAAERDEAASRLSTDSSSGFGGRGVDDQFCDSPALFSPLDLAKRLATLRTVDNVFRIGSTTSSRSSDCYSDTDLLAVCESIPSPTSRLRCYRELERPHRAVEIETLNLKSWEFGVSDSFRWERDSICVMFYTKEALLAKLTAIAEGDGERHGFYIPTGFLSAISSAESLSGSKCTDYQRIFSAATTDYPEPLRQRTMSRASLLIPYLLSKISIGLARGDLYYAQQCLFHLRESTLALLFAVARQYRVSDKRMPAALVTCRAHAPEPLYNLAAILVATTDYSAEEMTRAVTTLAPLIASWRDSECMRA